MEKLYRAWSTVDKYHNYEGVCFNWHVQDRPAPVAPYGELIADYDNLQGELERAFAEDYVNELFTETEIEELRAYLAERYSMDLSIAEEEIPHKGGFMPHSGMPLGGGQDVLELSMEDGYALSFCVGGYYDLRRHQLSIDLAEERARDGERFIEMALDLLGAAARVEDGRLTLALKAGPRDAQEGAFASIEELLAAIYDRAGLYVFGGQTREQRLEQREAYTQEDDIPF